MQPFSIGDIYYDDNNMRIVDINPIGKNCCTFDCVFCPIGKTDIKTDKAIDFKGTQEFLERLKNFLNNNSVDMVFINPSGEAILNNKIKEIITYIKEKKIKVRIITNGYIFNMSEYINIYNYCDEVIAEIAVMENKYFKKLQRPLEEFTLNEYIKNLKIFRQQYKGRFILDIIILKNYSYFNFFLFDISYYFFY
ncbi:radical SAM domain-containing protein, partial [Clostridium tetanomorphum DSM 665]